MIETKNQNELRSLDWKDLLEELSELATSHIAREELKRLAPFRIEKDAINELKKPNKLDAF